MPTSTLISYAQQGVNYLWDATVGLLFTSGMLTFWIIFLIILGVLGLVLASIKGLFKQ